MQQILLRKHKSKSFATQNPTEDTKHLRLPRTHCFTAQEILGINKILFSLMRNIEESGDMLKANTVSFYTFKILPPSYFPDQSAVSN